MRASEGEGFGHVINSRLETFLLTRQSLLGLLLLLGAIQEQSLTGYILSAEAESGTMACGGAEASRAHTDIAHVSLGLESGAGSPKRTPAVTSATRRRPECEERGS